MRANVLPPRLVEAHFVTFSAAKGAPPVTLFFFVKCHHLVSQSDACGLRAARAGMKAEPAAVQRSSSPLGIYAPRSGRVLASLNQLE